MRKNYINFNGNAEREFIIDSFKSITAFGENLVIDKNLSKGFMRKFSINALPCEIIALYTVKGKTYVYGKDGNLYSYSDELGAEKIAEIGGAAPLVSEVLFGGVSSILCIGETQAFILNGDKIIPIEFAYGNLIAVYNGRVYTADKSVVTFGGTFDFLNYSITKAAGVISVPDGAGKIVNLTVTGGCLNVVCENCVYKLTANDGLGFELVKYADLECAAEEKTVKNIGGKIYYLSRGKLAVIDDGRVSYKSTLLEKVSYVVSGNAVCFQNKYLLPITIGDNIYAFTYDVITGSECFERISSGVCSDSGYFAENDTFTLVKFSGSGALIKQVWQSEPQDFSHNGKKLLSAVEIYVGGSATLEITGDFGERSVPLIKGNNIKKLSLPSKEFTFKLTVSSLEEIAAKNFKIKYKILGG